MMYQQDLMVISYSRRILSESSYNFLQWLVNDWNSLLIEVVQVRDVELFKIKHDFLESHLDWLYTTK